MRSSLHINLLVDNWVTVPTNSTLTVHKQTVMIHPIVDEFHNSNPSCSRNSDFARDKGLTGKTSPADPQTEGLAKVIGHSTDTYATSEGLIEK